MPGLVIQEVYSNGGSTGSTYNADYVVIHNTSSAPITLTGYSIQFNGVGGGASSLSYTVTNLDPGNVGTTIPAYGFFLVQMGSPSLTNGVAISPTPNVVSSFTLGNNQGKIALVNSLTALNPSDPVTSSSIVDFVGYGTTFAEGGTGAPSPTTTQSIQRDTASGGWDTNNNSIDFLRQAPNPRNSSSATVNADPELTADSIVSLPEGNTLVLNASTFDAEGEGEGAGLIYSIVADAAAPDNTFFSIDATGALSFVTAPQFESPMGSEGNTYKVKIRATDSGGAYDEQIVTVTVTNGVSVSLTPVETTIAENTVLTAALHVADITLDGAGAGLATLTLSGEDADYFEIVSGDLFIKAGALIDFERTPALDVRVNAFDPGATIAGATADFSIAVTDVTPENVTGTPGDDFMTGGAGTDTFIGLGGNDTLDGGAGNDVMTGGLGNDTYYVNSSGDKVIELAGQGTDTIIASIDILSLTANIENVVMTGAARRLIGNSLNNTITGSNGNELINGWSGNDTIEGGAGDDSIYGYSGNDTASYEHASARVEVSLSNTKQQDTKGAGRDLLIAIENLTGSAFDDILTGNSSANVLTGLAGHDFLFGMAGNDTLIGGAGNDYLDGGAGVDIASYANETSAITVTLNSPVVTVTLASGTDTLIAIEGVTGGSGGDTLTGGAGNDILDGGAGNDTIEGGAGTDILIGGSNGTTGDTVSYANAAAGVKVNLALTAAQNTVGAGSDKLSGFENLRGSNFDDTLTGSAGDNAINGRSGNDKLYGGAGNDTLQGGQNDDLLSGGAGNDLLNGGPGVDTFLFNSALGTFNVDTIQDFTISEGDKFSLENAIFNKIGPVGALNAAAFVSAAGAVAAGLEDRIIHDTATGNLFYDADGSGTGAQVQFAVVYSSGTTPASLSAADFLII